MMNYTKLQHWHVDAILMEYLYLCLLFAMLCYIGYIVYGMLYILCYDAIYMLYYAIFKLLAPHPRTVDNIMSRITNCFLSHNGTARKYLILKVSSL